MGWTIPYDTPKLRDLIEERTASHELRAWTPGLEWEQMPVTGQATALRHCYRGNAYAGVLYIVWEQRLKTGAVLRSIEVTRLKFFPQGRGEGTWGYKDMSCCSGADTSCPPSYLELSPPHDSQICRDWHETVRQEHAARVARAADTRRSGRGASRRGLRTW